MRVDFIPWLARLASNALFVLRRGHSHGRARFLRTYVRVELVRLLVRLFKLKPTTARVFGSEIEFFDYETFAILFEEIYVGDMYAFASRSAVPAILDCGANIGMAVLYFKTRYPSAHITAFEADPVTHAMLVRNIARNGWSEVRALNVALSGSRGTATLYGDAQRGGLSHSILPTPYVREPGVQVEARQLSEFVAEPIDLLKMDIEGAEDDVLAELSSSGALRQIQQIIAEYHLHLNPEEDRLGRFLRTLEEAGFGYQVRANLPLPFTPREPQCLIVFAYRKAPA